MSRIPLPVSCTVAALPEEQEERVETMMSRRLKTSCEGVKKV